jgi:lactate permease
LIVFFYYALLPGALGYSIVWSSTAGVLNVGTLLTVLIFAVAAYMILTNRNKLWSVEAPPDQTPP